MDVINLIEHKRSFPTQAYMLIYIKEDERAMVLEQPKVEHIPEDLLSLLNRENEMIQSMINVWEECRWHRPVYLITPETVAYCNYKDINIDLSSDRFYDDPARRLKLLVLSDTKIAGLLELIARDSNLDPEELAIFRIRITDEG